MKHQKITKTKKCIRTVTGCKISTDNSVLPWCTVATTDHPGRLRNHNTASQGYPHYRKHQVAIIAHDHWWSRRRACGGTRKQTYSLYIDTYTRWQERPPYCTESSEHMYEKTLRYTEVLHDKLGQDPLHGREESKIRL